MRLFLTTRQTHSSIINRLVRLFVGLVLVAISLTPSFAQTYNYYNESFAISGSTSVCVDGTTTYTYYGPISNLTWSVSGGTIVGSSVGYSVQVRWTNTSNSLSATGQDQNCWYDPEYWPPHEFCDITTYTSNSFSVSHAVNGGYVNGITTLCSPGSGSLTLVGYSGSIARWEYSTGGSWTTISNTSATLNYSNVTTATSYRAVVQSGSCSATSSAGSVYISIPSIGGTLSGTTALCTPGSGTLTLSGHTGSIIRWEYSTGGGWSTISNTSTTHNYASLTTTTSYRAIVKSGVCSEAQSSTATITINPTTVGGTTSGASTLCAPASGTINLGGHTGSVLRWEYLSGGSWITVENTTSTLNYSGLTTSTTYRAVVKSGACSQQYSSTTQVTVHSPSVGGTLGPISAVYATSAAGTISLTGYSTDIQRWEKNTGSGWTTIANFNPTYNYDVSQSTTFRVAITNGVCAETYSNHLTIQVFSPIVITPDQQQTIVPGNSVQFAVNSGYTWHQWYRDGVPIDGANSAQYTAYEPGIYFAEVKGSPGTISGYSVSKTLNSVTKSFDNELNSVSTVSVLQEGVADSASIYNLAPNKVAQTITYADGLGRPFQSIAVGQSPLGGDVVAAVAHGKYGVAETRHLPYAVSERSGRHRPLALRGTTAENSYTSSEQYLFYQGTSKVAQDQYPYAVSKFSDDPSLRIYEQGAAGQDWQPTGAHSVRSTMTLNNTTTYKVRYWNTAGITSANYPINAVMVNISTDENGNKVQTYIDPRGLTVLRQVQIDETLEGVATTWLETYYIYDEWGRISYILPPKAMKVLGTGASLNANSDAVAELIHRFTYDPRGRLIEKKVPAAALQFIIYDKLDRVVLTQDGNLRSGNKWMFVKYDVYNRVAYTGIYQNNTQVTRSAVQGLLDAIDYTAAPWYETESSAGVHGYTNSVFPTTGSEANKILSVAYYDHYNFDRTSGDDYTYDAAHFQGQEAARSFATRGLSTGGKRVVLDAAGVETSYWITSAVFYDKYDRPVQTQTNNHLHTGWTAATLDKSTVIYDFVKPLKTLSTHYQNATTSVTLEDWNDYDHAGRVMKTYRKINGGGPQLLAQYEYNALGQVVDKKLHELAGGSFLQSVDYRYTIRGWLKTINNATLTADASNDETNDFFGMELVYQAAESGMGNTQYYNGNISAIKWKGPGTSGTADQRSYKYVYDKSDRLKSATFQANTGSAWTKEANTLNETMTYDHNGNIKTLIRKQNQRGNSGINVTSTAQDIDWLTYSYGSNLDKLTKVEDAASVSAGFLNGVNTTTEYTYSADGSLTADNNKGISSITYNMLGKPQVVNFTSGKKIEYIYDAAGTKLTVKTYQMTTLLTSTNYSGSFVYEGATPVLSFFGSPEGRVIKNGSNFEYQYAIADHQGNTRVVFNSATPSPSAITATFEGDGGDQTGLFTNVNAGNVVTFSAANHTTGGSKVIRMNQNYKVGPSKSMKVYPGDKVDAEVWTYYENNSGFGTGSPTVAAMVTAIASAFGGVSGGGGESGSIFNGVNSALGAFGLGGNAGDEAPAAYLNYVLYDNSYKFLDMGWVRVPTSAYFAKQKINLAQLNIKEAGYVFIYLSYEDLSNNYVQFDDFKVTHTKSNVVQYNEYYPFGMQTAGSWTRENTLGNNFLANGSTELNTTSNVYDLDYRNYDHVLGRMNGVDPMTTKYSSLSPYNYSFNDPVTFSDVSGADPWDEGPYGGSMAYYYAMQGQEGMSPGQETIMDASGNAFGPGGGNLNWNPRYAGGYGVQTGAYLNSMSLNYQNLQTIRLGRLIEGFVGSAMGSANGGLWSNGKSHLFNSPEEAQASAKSSRSGIMRNSEPQTRVVTVTVTRGTNYRTSLRTADARRIIGNNHKRGLRTISIKQPISVPTFAGGYLAPDIETGLKKLWSGSYKANGEYMMENLAFMTDRGLLILPNENNTAHSSSMGYYNRRFIGDEMYITYRGEDMRVYNYIHTHPDMSGIQKPTPRNDFQYTSETGIHSFIMGHFSVFEAFRNILGNEESIEIQSSELAPRLIRH